MHLCQEKRANLHLSSSNIINDDLTTSISPQPSVYDKCTTKTANKDEEIFLLKKQIEISERKLANAKHLSEAHIQFSNQVKDEQEKSELRAKEYFNDLKLLKEKYEDMELQSQIKRLTKSCKTNIRRIEDLENTVRESNCNPYLYTKRQIRAFEKRLESLKDTQKRQMSLLESISLKSKYIEDMRKAACNGDEKTVKTLLLQRIGVNIPDSAGFSAFMYACGNGRISIVQMMISVAQINRDDDEVNKSTPLILAIKHGKIPIISLLLEHGANVEGKDNVGKTALLTACECRGDPYEIILLLLDHGANVNTVDKYGNTALHLCAAMHDQNKEILQLLLERGADHTSRNYENLTAQKVAQTRHNILVVK